MRATPLFAVAGGAAAALLGGCKPAVCGTAEYVLVYEGGEGAMFDTDGDSDAGLELQRWEAEDWVQLGPGSTIGDPVSLPPDWVAPA